MARSRLCGCHCSYCRLGSRSRPPGYLLCTACPGDGRFADRV
ncbi:hypothetical protein [Lysobacter gummosus]